MLLGTLGSLLTGKGMNAKLPGRRVTKAGEGTIRVGQGF